jgi:hypothetical protein
MGVDGAADENDEERTGKITAISLLRPFRAFSIPIPAFAGAGTTCLLFAFLLTPKRRFDRHYSRTPILLIIP